MKTLARVTGVCVALGVVLLVGSTASAGWYVTPAVPTTTVVTYGPGATIAYGTTVTYPAPVVRVPVVPVAPIVPRIVVPTRVYTPGPAVIRYGPRGRVRAVYWR